MTKSKILLGSMVCAIAVFTLGIINSFAATDGIYTYYVYNNTATITDCSSSASGEITIPNTLGNCQVKSIDSYAFKNCSGLTGVIIPEGVTDIGSGAFANCSALTYVTVPSSVTTIEGAAFDGCKSLSRVNISSLKNWCTINFYDPGSNPIYYAKNLYLNGSLVTDLIIPEGVTSISYAAFYNCTSLRSVTFPDSLTFVGQCAFSECTNISAVYVDDIARWCEIDFYDVLSNPLFYANKIYLNGTLVTDLIIPNGVKKIRQCAFPKCFDFKSITIPESVTSIESSAFSNCTGLTKVIIPDSVTRIGGNAFYNCTAIEEVKFGKYVESIGDSAFYNCSKLSNVIIPDSVTSIGSSAFSNCTGIENVVIGDGVISIGSSAFSGCSGIVKLKMGDNVETIKAYAFKNCTGLAGITIPDSVSDLWQYVFQNCDLVICGEGGTYVKEYATLYSIPYVDINTLVPNETKMKTVCVTTASGGKVFVSNPCLLPENAKVILACYNNGRIIDVRAEVNNNEIIYSSVSEPFNSAKVMAWDSYESLKPACDVEVIQ